MKNLFNDLLNLLNGLVCSYSNNPKDHDWQETVDHYEADSIDGGTIVMSRIVKKCTKCGRCEDDRIDW